MEDQEKQYTQEELDKIKHDFRFHRLRFGIANLLFQGEEGALGAVRTAILKNLGATDRHFGIIGACGGITRLFQFVAMPLLNHYHSYYRAMRTSLLCGVLAASLVAGAVLLGCIPGWGTVGIWAFIGWTVVMCIATGIQSNIEIAWIGEIVPHPLLGWFTSVKYIIGVIGLSILSLAFSWCYDCFDATSLENGSLLASCFGWLKFIFPNPGPHFLGLVVCCLLYLLVAASHIAAIILTIKVPDRVPAEAKFISSKASERINYRALPLWTYVLFFIFWTGGRTSHYAMTSIFLMRIYDMKVIGISVLNMVCTLTQALMIFCFGKISDRWGNRKLLMLVSCIVACSMYLWTLTAWAGWKILILSYLIEGMAGSTHAMLVYNYGIEIFPSKGRAAYFGVVHLILGSICVLLSLTIGEISHALENLHWSCEILGATFTHYHMIFLCCTTFTLCCVLPLLIVGNRVVKPIDNTPESTTDEAKKE